MDKRIREGIEACRPGSDDLRAPEMADVARAVERDPEARLLYDRVQRSDAAIADAMEAVPLPPGLADRLLEKLQAASQAPGPLLGGAIAAASDPQPTDRGAVDACSVSGQQHQSRKLHLSRRQLHLSRRQWIGLGTSSALAAGLLIAVGLFLSRPPAEIALEVLAEDWLKEVDSHANGWREIDSAPAGFELPSSLMASPVSWQPLGQYAKGVAYKVVHPKAGEAMLYVVRLSRPGLPTAPPAAPQSTTGGKAVGYWRSGKVIYVLVVPGDERNYRTFVRWAPSPLA